MAAKRAVERLLAGEHDGHAGWLSDGRSQLAQTKLAECSAGTGQWLRDAGLGPHDVSHAELDSSVPGVLTLLALLALGDSFVLTVAPNARQVGTLVAPRMCRWRIAIRPEAARAPIDPTDPGSFLQLETRDGEAPEGFARGRLLLRTSGSFGIPKLVVHTHEQVLANSANVIARLDLRRSDRVLIPVPIGHMYGLGAALLPALLVGADIELLADANLLSYLERERSVRPTVAFMTPNLARTLIRPRSAPPEHYRHLVVAGDKLDPNEFAALEAIHGRVINLYGSTELGVICADDAGATIDREDREDRLRAMSVGRALPGVELELRDVTHGAEERGVGELVCRHPFGFETYVDEHGRPVGELVGHGHGQPFPTRDLARIHTDGRVELHGRCDHAVKRDGRLVLLVEVEAALASLDGVALAAAITAGEGKRGRNIIGFCEPRPGTELSATELRRACQDRLPAYAVPDEIHVLDKLPLLASGKLDRKALQVRYVSPPP